MNTSQQLFETIVAKLPLPAGTKMHPLYEAMLLECCEVVIRDGSDQPMDVQQLGALTAFNTAKEVLKGTIGSIDQLEQPGVITLNYRGQSFALDRDHRLRQQS